MEIEISKKLTKLLSDYDLAMHQLQIAIDENLKDRAEKEQLLIFSITILRTAIVNEVKSRIENGK